MNTLSSYLLAASLPQDQIPEGFDQIQLFPGTTKAPRPYQVEDLAHLVRHLPRMKLLNDPGCGKTIPAQALTLLLAGWGNKSVWIMPPAVVEQFIESFHRDFGPNLEARFKIEFLAFSPGKRNKQIEKWEAEGWPDVLVTSYRMFAGTLEVLRVQRRVNQAGKPVERKVKSPHPRFKPGDKVTADNFGWAVLAARGYTFVGVDEAQWAKNPSSELWRALNKFLGDPEEGNGCLLMTGTPVDTNPQDAYGLIALTKPNAYVAQRVFENTHIVYGRGHKFALVRGQRKRVEYPIITEYKNLDLLHRNVYADARRVMKTEVVKDMPPKVITEIQVTLSPAHRKLYDKAVNERILEIGDRLVDATEAGALYQITQRMLLNPSHYSETPIKENTLLDALDSLVDSLGGRKLLVFAWYRESVEILAKHLAALNPVTLNGDTSPTGREKARQTFINDPTCKAMVANYMSGGAGVDGLQEVCSHAVYMDVCPWTGKFNQSTDRLWRQGQREAVNIYLMVPRLTVAVKLRNDLVRKEGLANEVMKDSKTLLRDLMGEGGLQGEIA